MFNILRHRAAIILGLGALGGLLGVAATTQGSGEGVAILRWGYLSILATEKGGNPTPSDIQATMEKTGWTLESQDGTELNHKYLKWECEAAQGGRTVKVELVSVPSVTTIRVTGDREDDISSVTSKLGERLRLKIEP